MLAVFSGEAGEVFFAFAEDNLLFGMDAVFEALKRDAALPRVVLGPVDFCALLRLAAVCLSVGIRILFSPGSRVAGGWKGTGGIWGVDCLE